MSAGLKRWKPYPAYKDSGVEWLGPVPEGWEIKQVRRVSPILRGASPRPIDDPIYFDDNGLFAWVRIADVTSSEMFLEKTTQQLSELGASLSVKLEPDSLFLSIAGSVGKPCITKIKCCIHDGFVYFPNMNINNKFLFYIFKSGEPYKGLGKMGTQLNLNTDTVGSIKIPVPPLPEQLSIAAFLDQQCAQIDSLIEKKQRMLVLLDERRRAVITQAVTRGLDPTVPMKDSGVEWLGMVPEGWEVKRLRFLVTTNPSKAEVRLSSNEFASFVPMEAVGEYGGMQCQECCLDEVDSGYTFFADGDILIAKITPCFENVKGAIAENLTNGIGFGSTEFHVVRPLSAMNTAYCFWVTISSLFRNIGEAHMYGAGGQKRIPDMFIKNFPLPTPPLPEQQAIADYLDAQCAAMDSQRKSLEKSIELLREYRASLITHAVTGKIDVRDIAPLQ